MPTHTYPSLDRAFPIVGHLPEMYRRFPQLCARGEAAHGPLFWIHGGPGARQLMCTDPEALAVLRDPAVSTSFYADGFGALLSNTLFTFDGAEHRRVRGMMSPAFTPGHIRKSDVLQIVRDAAERGVDEWVDAGRVDVLTGTKEIALEIIFRIIGVPQDDLAVWRKQFGRYLLGGLPSRGRIRGPLFWIARRGRDWLDARLGALVEDLRRSEDASTLVGAIANSKDEDGAFLDTTLVVANLRLLALAGHETTASALAWSVLHLAGEPAWQERSVQEVAGVDDLVALGSDASRFTFAEALFREAVRMYPAVHSVVRRVTADVQTGAGTLPSGALVNVPLVHLLRNPTHFPDPDRFDPDRWAERTRPGRIETAMFGGGPHFCLGYHIAIAEGTLFHLHLARALGRRSVRMQPARPGPVPAPVYLPLAHPPRGQAVTFSPR